MRRCVVRQLHTVAYENGMAMQERLVERRKRDEIEDHLLLLEHPPVITKGKTGKVEHLLASRETLTERGARYYETTRGGDITWHGPGQIVGYPILHLGEGRRDVRRYVNSLETVITSTLRELGIDSTGSLENRGVWVGDEKVAAIGVRISRWTTSHGFALNLDPDLSWFDLITPCGIADKGVTSIAALLGNAPPRQQIEELIMRKFAETFERELEIRQHDLSIVKVVVMRGDHVLLLRRNRSSGDFWQPITGRIESDETSEAAAQRELREETGLELEVRRLSLEQSFVIDPEYLGVDDLVFTEEKVFLAEAPHGSTIEISPEEHQAYEWFTLAQAIDQIRWPDDREAIKAAAAERATAR